MLAAICLSSAKYIHVNSIVKYGKWSDMFMKNVRISGILLNKDMKGHMIFRKECHQRF